MGIPVSITDLSTTAASNYPQGTDSPSTLDDTQRAHGAFIRQLHTGAVTTTANVTSGTINGATVGATTPSTGAFTTLSATTTGADNTLHVTRTSFADAVVYAGGTNASFGTTNNYPVTVVVNNSNVATFDTSGNLGLGVPPSAITGGKFIQYGGASGGGLVGGNNAGNAIFLKQNTYPGAGGDIYIASNLAADYYIYNGTHVWRTAPSGTAGNAITFTQAMTLDASGNLLVGTTSAALSNSNSLVVAATSGYTATQHANGTASTTRYAYYAYNGVEIGSITQSGTTAVVYNTTSDHRLKTNVRPANAAKFMDIEFVDFEWTDGRHDCGVIAHQLQSVYPDLVLGEKDATETRTVEITPAVLDDDGNVVTPAVTEEQTFPKYQQVNYTGLIGRIGTRVQQLQRTVDAQAAIIAAMESRLAALESRNA